MTNFSFLQKEWPDLYEAATKAEALAFADARAGCFYARRTLELAVERLHWVEFRRNLTKDDNLSSMIWDLEARNCFPAGISPKLKLIRKNGNDAAHSKRVISQFDALQATKELFHVLYWLVRTYTRRPLAELEGLAFDQSWLEKLKASVKPQSAEQLRKLEEELRERDRQLAEEHAKRVSLEERLAELTALVNAKQHNRAVPDTHDYSEAETRSYIIDLLLKEAGWNLSKPEDREFPVTGMPNNTGDGFVDYVLWGDDGTPFAIVEAKRTTKDPRIGQQQAKLYADCLEARYGVRPVMFLTNGFQTWFWDDLEFPPRTVQGFYTKDELLLLQQRRTTKVKPGQELINHEIVERSYQIEAIRRVVDQFHEKRRRALVVMATGSGKTRTVIALCELLQRCNWAKRILFLADRKALVKQAVGAFKAHWKESNPVNLVTDKEETGSRVYVSTYPTMMNLINDMQGNQRRFGVGYFDLIVIDEAHRSVYQKYRALFEYFDGLLVGLTATPKDEVHINTYELFDLKNGMPTYAYDLDEAVKDRYLVPPQALEVPTKFTREGVDYNHLSEAEKEQWEELDWDEDGAMPERVEAPALNSWLFNADTVDKILEFLMSHGLKVAGGDRLGKTIIFAKNHDHAMFIQARFDANYPKEKGSFARVIDVQEAYAQNLIDDFSQPDKSPHIAISVDMLDTGIDVPEVLNLVFFKPVRSKTKYYQMIGRGTRLCKNIFGPGADKEFFYIFDCCDNIRFFNHNLGRSSGSPQPSLSAKLFTGRLHLLNALGQTEPSATDLSVFSGEIKTMLQREIGAMNPQNFLVRPHHQLIEKFRNNPVWENLTPEDMAEMANHLAGLPTELEPEDETAKRFDMLILKLQMAVLQKHPSFETLRRNVQEIAVKLSEKATVPMIAANLELILEVLTDDYWANITLPLLETMRRQLRNLVQFIDKRERKLVYSDFADELGEVKEVQISAYAAAVDFVQYRKKVLEFLERHENHLALRKLKHNQPITALDIQELERFLFESGEIGNREDFEKVFGKQDRLGTFIRNLVGLDRAAGKAAFNDYLSNKTLTANQIQFINLIIDYLTQNGVMDAQMLYESPFTDFNPNGLDGVFADDDADRIVEILKEIETNAAA
ncbi:MAG: DEAD/DEAH box helicase family protein [Blastocatellia bacterium]|nr:DEAD/DEAH box helicase family protein [Blastocatellia bacterium]